MKLEFTIIAENADRLEDGRLVIFGGDFNLFQVSKVPATVPFFLVSKISAAFGEPLEGHKYKLEIQNPAGERKPMGLDGVDFAFGVSNTPQLPSIAHVFTKLVVTFKDVGVYTFFVMIDEVEMGSVSVIVRLPSEESK
jgi:hypothetical protein